MFEKRVTGLFWFFVLVTGIVIMKIYILTVSQGDMYSQKAVSQQEYIFDIARRRGIIYDCNLKELTYDKDGYAALVEPAFFQDKNALLELLTSYADEKPSDIDEKIKKGKPFTIRLWKIPDEQPGITVIKTREQDNSGLLSHIIGTTNSDGVGVSGLEKAFDRFLSQSGGRIYGVTSVNAGNIQLKGTPVSLFSEHYYDESGIITTIDKDIQEVAEKAADSYVAKGAILVSDVKTGEIKAMVSRPNFDKDHLGDYLNSKNGELVNRCLSQYNLGSIFKIVVTSAALESGSDIETRKHFCNGEIIVDGRSFSCHKKNGHGVVGLDDAFKSSCNPFFIDAALRLGLNPIVDMIDKYGLNERTTLAEGMVSGKNSFPVHLKDAPDFLVANTAIGQGNILITPLDVLSIINTVANNGVQPKLSLVKGFLNKDGSYVPYEAKTEDRKVISAKTAQRIQQLMVETCESGTGTTATPGEGGAGGKTASAETGWKENGDPVTHAWFAGFYPAENPQYSIVVLVENGKSGSIAAAPAFRQIANRIADIKDIDNVG
ncbi:MAG: penicillin-binding protein 2 [Bacillota bacterium]|nr:penicillin-binding protein 2 [Bacillota bacterium]